MSLFSNNRKIETLPEFHYCLRDCLGIQFQLRNTQNVTGNLNSLGSLLCYTGEAKQISGSFRCA